MSDAATILLQQRDAFLRDGPPTLEARKADLKALRRTIIARRRDIEQAVDVDFGGRSHRETALLDILGTVQAIDYLSRNLKRFMRPERRHVAPTFQLGRAYVEYQPLGVIGIMSPWNYPFLLAIVPVATALAAGNRAMLKPSELTPRTSQLIEEMLAAVFPQEKVAVVLGDASVGAAFSGLAFDHLFFTGSTEVGRHVMAAASANLVPVTLELGGKSPTIIQKGHATQNHVASIAFGKLTNAGQTCVAPDYVFLHEDDLAAFTQAFEAAVAQSYPKGVGTADFASIVSDRHFTRLNGLLEDARQKGARVVQPGTVGDVAPNRIRVMPPTLVFGATDEMTVMREEIFGPVLPVRTYRDIGEVISFINARPRPLALYFFGEEHSEDCRAVLARTTSGNVGINNTMLHVAQDDLPFGGVGASGMGAYHGIEGFRRMSHAKGVFVRGRWSLPTLLRAPFGRLTDWALAFLLR